MTALFILVVVVGLLAWGYIVSKRTSENKKAAIAELKVQKEQIEPFDIHALVSAEIAELGLRDISGAAGIPASALLKTWKEGTVIVDGCPSRPIPCRRCLRALNRACRDLLGRSTVRRRRRWCRRRRRAIHQSREPLMDRGPE